MSAIFISHSSKDKSLAAEVFARLRERGYQSVFLDQDRDDGIMAGEKWERVLYRELRACQVVVALVSDNWVNSRWCFAEATHAREKGKTMLGLRINPGLDCSLLADTQLVDFTPEHREQGYEFLWRGLGKALDWRGALHWDDARPPYPGLDVFEEADASVYFGRDETIRELKETLERLRREWRSEKRSVIVLGASGSGKSSLVRAGLVPLLKRGLEDWLVVGPFRPQEQPLNMLAQAFAQAFAEQGEPRDWKTIRAVLASTPEMAQGHDNHLADLAGDLRMQARKPHAMVLLVIDQMEELLGRVSSSQSADGTQISSPPPISPSREEGSTQSNSPATFFSLLRWLLSMAGRSYMVLSTLRSDFLGDFQNNPGAKDIPYEPFPLKPMQSDDFIWAIEGPAQVAKIDLEPGLARAIVEDTATSDALPLLAFTLNRLWKDFGQDGQLTITDYRNGLGGLQGSLNRRAEETLPSHPLTATHERILQGGFLSLVRISDEGQFLRWPVRWRDLSPTTHSMLQNYVEARLLVSRSERVDGGGDKVVEVVHETLFRAWERLRGWLQDRENQEFLTWRERFRLQCNLWERSHEDTGLFLRGAVLKDARRWVKQRGDGLNELERKFVANSDWSARKKPILQGAAALLVLIVVSAGVWRFILQSKSYVANREVGEIYHQLGAQTESLQNMLQPEFASQDAHFITVAANLPNVQNSLEKIKDAVTAAQLTHAGKSEEQFAACTRSINTAIRRANGAAKATKAEQYGLISALLSVNKDEDRLTKVIDSCLTKLNAKLASTAIEEAGLSLARIRGEMEVEFRKINQDAASKKAKAYLENAKRSIDVKVKVGDAEISIERSETPNRRAEDAASHGLSPLPQGFPQASKIQEEDEIQGTLTRKRP